MKHRLYRVELLLLLLPLVFLAIQQFFFRDVTVDAHLHDTMYVVAMNHVIVAVIILHLLLWFFHWLLRAKGWRTAIICTGHVVITSVALLFLFVPLFLSFRSGHAGLQAAAIWLVVHLAFLLYFLFTVIKNALFSK